MQVGSIEHEEDKYYTNEEGVMQTDWLQERKHMVLFKSEWCNGNRLETGEWNIVLFPLFS